MIWLSSKHAYVHICMLFEWLRIRTVGVKALVQVRQICKNTNYIAWQQFGSLSAAECNMRRGYKISRQMCVCLVTRQLQITSTWLASLHSHVQRPGSWEWLHGNRWPRPKPTESFSSFTVGVVTAHWRKLNTNVPGNVKSESLLK